MGAALSSRKRNAFARRARGGASLLLALSAGAVGLSGVALLASGAAHAQSAALGGSALRFERLGVEDGLSQGAVHAIAQDRRGFLWFGTDNGLDRYDGHTFTHYEAIPFDSTSLPSGAITAFTVARDGALWLGLYEGGVSRFDPATGRIRRYPFALSDSTALVSGWVQGIIEDRAGAIWISTDHGLTRLDPATGRFRRFFHRPADPHSLTSNCVYAAVEGADGAVWVGTNNGVNRLDPATGRVTRFFYNAEGPSACGAHAHTVVSAVDLRVDPGDPAVLWLAGRGLSRFDTRTGQRTVYWPEPARPAADLLNRLAKMAPDPYERGVLWITTPAHGLLRFDARTGTFTRFRHDRADPHSLQSDAPGAIYADRTGSVWVGSATAGVRRFDPSAAAMALFRSVPGDPSSLSDGLVFSVIEDREGVLWVGTREGGLNRVDRRAGTVTVYRHDPDDPTSLGMGWVTSLFEDRAGALWVGTEEALSRLDRRTGRFTHWRHDPDDPRTLTSGRVWSLLEEETGELWVATNGGLSRLDPRTGAVARVAHDPDNIRSLGNSAPWVLHKDRAGALWVGTFSGGLFRLDVRTGALTRFEHNPADTTSLTVGPAWALHERAREPGVLWVGTAGGGLDRLDTRTGAFTHFTRRDGLPDQTINDILEDDEGRLWLSTNRGLARFTPETGAVRTYGMEAGLQGMEFDVGAAHRSPSGELFFGGVHGLSAFYPARLRSNPTPPQVALTAFRLFNRPVEPSADGPLRAPLGVAREVRLDPDESMVTFEFVALHFRDPARNRYAYRLDGFDAEWVQAGAARTATYTSLPPGRYTFRVRAANSDGVWNREGASIGVVVRPAWWQTAWARLLGVLAVAGLVWGGYRWRTAQVRVHNEALRAEVAQQTHALTEANGRLQEVDRKRRDFFANVSHEFRTPLTLILGPLDDVRQRLRRPESVEPHRAEAVEALDVAHLNARRLLRLINELLDAAKLEAGAMRLDARPGDLARLVRAVAEPFVGLAERGGVAFHVEGTGTPLEAAFDADAVEKVLANLLSNAFKFTPAGGAVELRLERAARDGRAHAAVSVRDSGPGIAEEALPHIFERFYRVDEVGGVGTGIGLALAKELAELHGGTVEVESAVGSGSVFTFLLPLEAVAAPAAMPSARPAEPEGRTEARTAAEMLEPEIEDSQREIADSRRETEDSQGETGSARRIPDPAPALLTLRVQGDGLAFDADLVAVAEEAAHEAAEAEAGRPLVLVADDHPDIRAYVGRHLRPRYRVVEAADGAEALQKAREHPPDLVLSDVMMPGLDGLALLRALKADPETDFVPVVLLTARAAVEDRLEGLQAEADDYLTKPFEPAELVARIENLVAGRQRLRARLAREAAGAVASAGATPTAPLAATLHAAPVAVASADAAFLERVREAVEEQMGEATFGVEALADAVGMSRVHLFRRLRELCGEAPSALLVRMRLERAAALLRGRSGSVSEVAYGVGFRSVSYFARAFRARFGTTPSAYAEGGGADAA